MPESREVNDMIEARILDTAAVETAALKELANELIEEVRFASGKAKAHLHDPRAFPVSANRSALERILVDLSHEAQDPAGLERLKAEGSTFAEQPLKGIARTRHARFHAVNLRKTTPIHEQLAVVREPAIITTPTHTLSGSLPTPPDEPISTLTWHLNKVHCEEETGLTDAGTDHLYIGGTTIDPFGNVTSGGVHDLGGGWDSHEKLPFNTNLAISNLSHGVGWPRTYYYIVAISVRGSDKLYEFLDKVVEYARDYAVNYLATAAGGIAGAWVGLKAGAIVGSLGGPIGAAVGAAIGALVGYLVGELIGAAWNEISGYFKGETKLFPPITIEVNFPMQGALSSDGTNTLPFPMLTWKGYQGEYRLHLDAKVNWIPSFNPAAIVRLPDRLELATTDGRHGIQLKTWGKATDWAWSEWKKICPASISPDAPICLVSSVMWSLDAITILLFAGPCSGHRDWELSGETTEWHSEYLPGLDAGLITGSAIGAASRGQGMVDIFVTGKNGHVYTAARGPQTNNVWAGWWKVGEGVFLPGTPIAAISRSEGRLDIFATGLDGRVWSAAYGPGTDGKWDWVGWFPVLNEVFVPGTRVDAISRKTDQIDLFAVNLGGEVRTAAWSPSANSGKWGGWWRITEDNGTFALGTPISSVSRGADHLDIFAIGLDGRVWTAAWGSQTDSTWKGWWPIGSAKFSQGAVIAATARSLNHIDLFMRGFDGNIWSHAWDGDWKSFVV
jgi:hypothetical protein